MSTTDAGNVPTAPTRRRPGVAVIGLRVLQGLIVIAYLFSAWWAVTAPGAALFVAIFGLNVLGNGLRDVLDPQG